MPLSVMIYLGVTVLTFVVLVYNFIKKDTDEDELTLFTFGALFFALLWPGTFFAMLLHMIARYVKYVKGKSK